MVNTKTIHERLGKNILADGMSLVMNMEESKGSYIKDDNGDTYLDMFSMFASMAVGYNHPYILEHQEFLGKMAVNKPSMSDIYNKEYAEFLETFCRVAIPEELSYTFFVSGGALAVENALKAAFDWKTRHNQSKGIKKEADKVIHFKEAFHGRSGYTMSLTNTSDPRKYMYFPKFDWPRVVNPKMYFPLTDDNLNKTREQERLAIEQIEVALETYENQVACIILETIQGEGGDNFFRKEFLHKLREICDENDILLIFDEVQCGMGITGKMWAFQHYDITPDVISFGKKSQVCGILANKEKFNQVENHVFKESSRINSTFGGNFIDMMRFKLILEIIEKENLVENAVNMGEVIKAELEQLDNDFKDVSNVRNLGLWAAFDLPTGEDRSNLINDCYDNKLLVLPCGDQSVRLRPHLTVNEQEIKDAFAIIRRILRKDEEI